jgi:putative aminopeptidase FrvX
MNLTLLKKLIYCHSTPGEEDELMSLMAREWQKQALSCYSLGRYAIIAQRTPLATKKPHILFCAHADSPGYIVQAIKNKKACAIPLGGASFTEDKCKAIIKTSDEKKYKITLRKSDDLGESEVVFNIPKNAVVSKGDRIAFAPTFTETEDGFLEAPFFDNRVGCFLLCELQKNLAENCPYNISFAVTAAEEFTGFGADVLANHLQADLVICLDATYTSEEQEVFHNKGPVLTLSDKSILVGSKNKKLLEEYCRKWKLPLQSEVYNFSGTDARAFPQAGNLAIILPLLIPSEGNHSPIEQIAKKDLENTAKMLMKISTEEKLVQNFQKNSFIISDN